MQPRLITAILLGKLIIKTSQFLKLGGGSAAPGLYALKICPDLVSRLVQQIPQTIIITGTNGKTTTARMLSHFAKSSGLKVIRNATGSNLHRGIASALISHSHIVSGKLKKMDLAIWELDEAAFTTMASQLKPNVVVFLNAFRDQLDRYGEVDTVIQKWSQTLKNLPKETIIYINGDDENLFQLKRDFQGKTQTFGVENYKIKGEKVVSETEIQPLDWEAKDISLQNLDNTTFNVSHEQELFSVNLPLPGIYNIYNFLAAFACANYLKLPNKFIVESMGDFSPAFGRVEKITITAPGGKATNGYIFLIKNPAGATQVLQTIKDNIKEEDRLLIALNDNLADGTDVSWIWDVDFELFKKTSRVQIFVSGTRAQDLALRLKYADFEPKQINIDNNLKNALEASQKGLKGRLFILPTYTALLQLQKHLASGKIKKHYWKEN